MAALSDYAEKLLLDWSMTTGSATRPTAWYVALYTAAPSDSGGGTEVSKQFLTFHKVIPLTHILKLYRLKFGLILL